MPKKLVDYLELYEKLHFHELRTREHITARLQMSLTLLVALAGAMAFLIRGFDPRASGPFFVIFVLLLAAGTSGLVVSAFHLKKAFWNNSYKEMPRAKVVRDHEGEVHDYYHEPPPPRELVPATKKITAADLFDNHFRGFLIDKFVNTATHNATVNDARADHLHEANRAILVTAGVAFLAFLVFTVGGLRNKSPAPIQLTGAADVNVLSLPADCLTCQPLPADTCANKSEEGCPPNEQQRPAAAGPVQTATQPATGADGQGGDGAPSPATAPVPAQEAVK